MAGKGGPRPGSGRKPGSPNSVTQDIRENFRHFVDNNFPKVQSWLDRVAQDNPAKAAELYLAFSERILGKVSNTNVDVTTKGESLIAPSINVIGSPNPEQ